MAGEARLVQLQKIDAWPYQGLHLAVDDIGTSASAAISSGRDRLAPPWRQPARVYGPGTGTLDRRVGEFAEPLIFLDEPQTVRARRAGSTHSYLSALVVRGRSPAPTLRQRSNPGKSIVEAEIEIDTLHLTVGDQVGPGLELVVNRQPHGITNRFLAVVGSKLLRAAGDIVAELGVPSGERPAADDGRGYQGKRRHEGTLFRAELGCQ